MTAKGTNIIASPTSKGHGPPIQVYVDRFSQEHRLIPGYRSKIKPGWAGMFKGKSTTPDNVGTMSELRSILSRVRLGTAMLETLGCQLDHKLILDVGSGDGEEVMCLAGLGAASVVGADYAQPTHDGNPVADRRRQLLLAQLEELGQRERFDNARRTYVRDDIGSSSFADASFDVVCSWRTLEHLIRPAEAFSEMYRILRPGGFAFHEYNPFFAVDGGHSPVTLDFPWGHVRLAAEDVERYVERFRPDEKALAMDFYQRQLNRMTISDMERMARDAGFDVLALVPRARTEDLLEVTQDVYKQARRIYPGLTLNDLVCRVVRLVLRRPEV